MVIEFDVGGLQDGAEEVGDIADGLDEYTSRGQGDTVYDAIESAVEQTLQNPILREARQRGSQYVGERVSTIRELNGEWGVGKTYTAGIGSANPVVVAHERGTGTYAGRGAYRIDPSGDGKLAFEVGGKSVVVDYVVHPGVRGKGFMERALKENIDTLSENVASEGVEKLGDAVQTR